MPLSKVELRKTMKNLLSQKTKEEMDKKSFELSLNLIQLLARVGKGDICLGGFSPIQKEPVWFAAMKELPKLAFPRIEKENMDFYLASFGDLEDLGEYSIKEPKTGAEKVVPEILIIPGLAFNLKGFRLGRGGGHYDRYLSSFKGLRIGVCFETQIVEDVFVEPYDEKVDFIVTEKRAIPGL